MRTKVTLEIARLGDSVVIITDSGLIKAEGEIAAHLNASLQSPAPSPQPNGTSHQGADMHTKIESLNITSRTRNRLIDAGIKTVGQLIQYTEAEVMQIEGMGIAGLDGLKKVLSKHKLRLAE